MDFSNMKQIDTISRHVLPSGEILNCVVLEDENKVYYQLDGQNQRYRMLDSKTDTEYGPWVTPEFIAQRLPE
jgi:hypothetical protein